MDLIATLEAEQIASLGKKIPDFKAGDTVRVGYKVTEGTRTRVQNYEGVCISRKGGACSRFVRVARAVKDSTTISPRPCEPGRPR
jgi:ribosomal protein L19